MSTLVADLITDTDGIDWDDEAILSAPALVSKSAGLVFASERWADLAARQAAHIIGPDSTDMLDLAMAVVLCPALDPESPVWLFIAGPPSMGKTDTARRVKKLAQVVPCDKLTGAGLVSGYKDQRGRRATGLLGKLDGKSLVMSEMSTFFEQGEAIVKKVLGDLTAAYDGQYDNATGMDMDDAVHHVARFGFLGCTTNRHFDSYEHYIRKIGSRFLVYRLPVLTKAEYASLRAKVSQAIRHPDRRAHSAELTERVIRHLMVLWAERANLSADLAAADDRISAMAEVLAACRGTISDLGEAEQPEGFSRGYQQLRVLGQALAIVRGRPVVGPDELSLLWRVVLGSMAPARARAVRIVSQRTDGLTAGEYQEASGLGSTQVAEDLGLLVKLDLLDRETPLSETHKAVYRPVGYLLRAAGIVGAGDATGNPEAKSDLTG